MFRTVDFHHGKQLASRTSSILRRAWGIVVGAPLSECQWQLASFPIRHGGVGASDTVRIHAAAAVASFLAAASNPHGFDIMSFPPELRIALDELLTMAPSMASSLRSALDSRSFGDFATSDSIASWSQQHLWMEEVDAVAIQAWDASASSRLLRLRHLQSGAHAGAWLTMRPGESTTFCADEYQGLLRFRCGVSFGLNHVCQGCRQTLDPSGDHWSLGRLQQHGSRRRRRCTTHLAQRRPGRSRRWLRRSRAPGVLRPKNSSACSSRAKACARANQRQRRPLLCGADWALRSRRAWQQY